MAITRRKPVREMVGTVADTVSEVMNATRIAAGALTYEARMMKLESVADYKSYVQEVAKELGMTVEEVEKLI